MNPGDALVSAERTVMFREAVTAGSIEDARSFFLAGYADGAAERSNPKAKGAFARCVAEVAKKGGASDPRAVCAAAGRKKLGQAEMTRRAKAGKKKAAKNPELTWPRSTSDWRVVLTRKPDGSEVQRASYHSTSGGAHKALKGAEKLGYRGYVEYRSNPKNPDDSSRAFVGAQRKDGKYPVQLVYPGSGKRLNKFMTAAEIEALRERGYAVFGSKRNPKNPLDTATKAYEGFHGEAPTKTTVVQERVHYHKDVWQIGALVLLKVKLPSDRWQPGLKNTAEIEFDYEAKNPVRMCANEDRTQLLLVGGDQAVDVKVFALNPKTPHEKEFLGWLTDAWYFTDKKHLGNQGGVAIYKHRLGEEGGELPMLVYRTRDKRLEIVGGSYTIPDEGIRD